MKEEFEKFLKGRAFEYAVIPTVDIVFSNELLKACETNTCGMYNKCWTCPPASGSIEKQKERITSFSSAIVFTTKYDLEDSFDYDGMMKGKDNHFLLTCELHEKFGKTNPVYGAGACSLCDTCAYPEPCVFPEKIFSSIEAAGIDVTCLSKAGKLRYNNGENTVTYFSLILFN
jgi:predicted metal-binding protein